jgi:hypothetical protein
MMGGDCAFCQLASSKAAETQEEALLMMINISDNITM